MPANGFKSIIFLQVLPAIVLFFIVLASTVYPGTVQAETNIQPPSFRKLDQKVQLVKKNVIKLGHDFALLENGVSTFTGKEFVVYVALDVREGFKLEAIELLFNGEFATRFEFSKEVVKSLLLGGVKRIYTANITPDTYEIKAKLIGKVGKRHEYSNSITVQVSKTKAPKTVELKISNLREKFLPEFVVSEWDY